MYSNEGEEFPNYQPYSTQQFFFTIFSQYCPKMFKNKSYEQVFYKLLTSFLQESQKIIFIFFFGGPCHYFHFLFRFAQEFSFFICPEELAAYLYFPLSIGAALDYLSTSLYCVIHISSKTEQSAKSSAQEFK